jgi:transcriptional regulator with XRE-family HTH domain
MTQEELAELLGNGVRYVQAVEAGRQNVTLKTVAQFAAKLRIPVAAFFQAPSSKAPPPGRPRRS